MVAGFDVFDDDEILVHYVTHDATTLYNRFVRYSYDTDDVSWAKEFECIDL